MAPLLRSHRTGRGSRAADGPHHPGEDEQDRAGHEDVEDGVVVEVLAVRALAVVAGDLQVYPCHRAARRLEDHDQVAQQGKHHAEHDQASAPFAGRTHGQDPSEKASREVRNEGDVSGWYSAGAQVLGHNDGGLTDANGAAQSVQEELGPHWEGGHGENGGDASEHSHGEEPNCEDPEIHPARVPAAPGLANWLVIVQVQEMVRPSACPEGYAHKRCIHDEGREHPPNLSALALAHENSSNCQAGKAYNKDQVVCHIACDRMPPVRVHVVEPAGRLHCGPSLAADGPKLQQRLAT
mmetsp:Transcript_6701/g.15820  ORF Transcript_6701/g.15820 Transcript_6701/m.15820 type:complete len:295 (+) Transcript_6701:76-960(+)